MGGALASVDHPKEASLDANKRCRRGRRVRRRPAPLWAEDHDWIYYRKRKPNITSLSTALFQMQAIVQPEKQHIVDQKLEIKEDEDEDGDKGRKRKPPSPPSGSSA